MVILNSSSGRWYIVAAEFIICLGSMNPSCRGLEIVEFGCFLQLHVCFKMIKPGKNLQNCPTSSGSWLYSEVIKTCFMFKLSLVDWCSWVMCWVVIWLATNNCVLQVRGMYEARKPHIQHYLDQVLTLTRSFESFQICHIPRVLNNRPHNVAREAIKKNADRRMVLPSGNLVYR